MPEIQKVALATVDESTTSLCLIVHGQVQPASEPFDTLAGPVLSPPFHFFCRTMMDLYTDGLYGTAKLKVKASREVSRRVEKKGYAAWEKEVTRGTKLKAPTTGAQPVTKKISTELHDGLIQGVKSLDDVPDRDLFKVIDAVPERFTVTDNGGGISQSLWVKDELTGRKYVLKKGQFHNESVNEVIVSRLQEAMEQGLPTVRFADDVTGNGWVLIEHVQDLPKHAEDGWRVVGTAPGHGQIARMTPDLFDDQNDPMRIVLNDFLFDGADRKGGNVLKLASPYDDWDRYVPIDNALSLMGWRNSGVTKQSWELFDRLDVGDLNDYLRNTYGSPKGFAGALKNRRVVLLYHLPRTAITSLIIHSFKAKGGSHL